MLILLEQYEIWLQNIVSNFGKEHIANSFLLEENGTNFNDFKKIIDEIKKSIPKAKQINKNGEQYLYNSISIDDTFIANLEYIITFKIKNNYEGGFAYNSCYYDNNDKKLHNVKFIFNEHDFKFPDAVSTDIEETMWHEVHHAYVQYNVLKKLFNEKKSRNPKMDNQRKIYNDFLNSSFHPLLKDVVYYTNRNEIGSILNEMIPYLQRNKNINFTNYKSFLNKIPGYNLIIKLKSLLKWYEEQKEKYGDKFKESIGRKLNEIYSLQDFYKNKTLTPIDTTNRIMTKLYKTTIFVEHQFYKILNYTLKQLNRKQNFDEYLQHNLINIQSNYKLNFYQILNKI